jgi:hypothetical protein
VTAARRCHRAGVVRVVLVHVPRGQQPDPGAELGRDIQYPLTGGQQLLGQQVARAAGALDRPRSAVARPRPRPAAARPEPQARTRSSPSGSSAALIAAAVCEASCGSTPIITAAIGLPLSIDAGKTAAGTPDSKDLHGAYASLSHATARPRPAGTSFASQFQQGGRRIKSQPNRDPSTLRPRLTAIPARNPSSTRSLNQMTCIGSDWAEAAAGCRETSPAQTRHDGPRRQFA